LHAQPGKSTASEILHPHLIKLAQLCLHLQVSAGLPPRLVQSKGVGPGVGPAVGAAVGLAVGPADGAFVGMAEGTDVGLAVGPAVGEVVGRDVPPTSATKHTPSAHSRIPLLPAPYGMRQPGFNARRTEAWQFTGARFTGPTMKIHNREENGEPFPCAKRRVPRPSLTQALGASSIVNFDFGAPHSGHL